MKYSKFLLVLLAIFTLQNFIVNRAEATLSDGLLGYWTFDDGTGAMAHDSSNNGHDGNIIFGTGSANWVGGRVGQAISLDGQDDYISLGSQPSFGNLNNVTVSFWIYPKKQWVDQYPFISNGPIGTNLSFGVGGAWNGTASSRVWLGGSAFDFNTPIPAINIWTHVAFTYDSSANLVTFYKNGAVVGTKTWNSGSIPSSAQVFLIGKYNSNYFNGFIDDLRVYNRTLTAQEISDLYQYAGGSLNSSSGTDKSDTTAPSVPENLSQSNVKDTSATVSWNASTDNVVVSGYKVYRNNILLTTVTSGTSYTDSGITPGSTYLYRVSAFDAAGNESSQSTSLSITSTGTSQTQFSTTEIVLPKVLQGRQTYAGQHVMWKDLDGHVHIINSFGGADVTGAENSYFHYINTFTGAHALVEGGPCSFGRLSVYDPVHNKLYWYGEYCSYSIGSAFNEFDPVTMTNKVIARGGSSWFLGQSMTLGDDQKIYFTAQGHLYSYDPAVGASSWYDYGLIYGPSNGIGPGIGADSQYVYISWQDNTPSAYWHLMVHPISGGAWTEIRFPDGLPSGGTSFAMFIKKDKTTKKLYVSRTSNGSSWQTFWLQNGGISAVTGSAPDSGYAYIQDDIMKHNISMMDYGNYGEFPQAYGYDMNWDNNIPVPGNSVSTVHYGPHGTWNYPNSGYVTSTLTYNGPWYDLPVSDIVPNSPTNFYAFGQNVSDYNYVSQSTTPVANMPSASIYLLRVPAAYTPTHVDEVYYAGYPNRFYRWNPTIARSKSNPSLPALPQHMNYWTFMDFDSEGKVWIGGNACGASVPCTDYGAVNWYDPRDNTTGAIFANVWTGGSGGGNGIQFKNFATTNNRTKLVVSSSDGLLTVINAVTKSIEGSYQLGASAWMVEVAPDQVLGVTTSADSSGQRVFLFQPSTRKMLKAPQSIGVSGYTFGISDGHISRRNFRLEKGPDGYGWIFVDNVIYRINPVTLQFQKVATEQGSSRKLRWSLNGKDLLVFGGDAVSYYPNLLPSSSSTVAIAQSVSSSNQNISNSPAAAVIEEKTPSYATPSNSLYPSVPAGYNPVGLPAASTKNPASVTSMGSTTIAVFCPPNYICRPTDVSKQTSAQAYRFTRSLRQGIRGADVRELQQFLNSHGYIVAAKGAGSPKNETDYFGPATYRALIKFQNANRETILKPVGLTSGTGYFGPSTIKVINSMN